MLQFKAITTVGWGDRARSLTWRVVPPHTTFRKKNLPMVWEQTGQASENGVGGRNQTQITGNHLEYNEKLIHAKIMERKQRAKKTLQM